MNKRIRRTALLLALVFTAAALVFSFARAETLRRGSRGELVKQVQTRLKNWGYYSGAIDGIFGSGTENAVKAFQRKNGLTADGIIGKKTAAALGINIDGGSSQNSSNSGNLYLLASDEGGIWREEIIPLCKVNQSSATVIVTDNVRSMYAFNTGVAGLIEGRFFNDEDYTGNSVCMISAAYAQYNGYKIGDKLTLDFYDTGFFASEAIPRGSCLKEDRMNVTGEYEIVGIYSAPEFSLGEQLFCADTILIPKKAVPGSDEFSTRPSNRLITSLILKNGTKESFLSYMEHEGYKDAYICFDQNFGAAEVSVDALVKNGQMLLWIGIAAFIITAALAHFLTMRRFAPSAKTMRILGIDRKVVAKQAVGAFILIDAIAALLGAGLAAAVFSTVTEKAVSTALSPDYPVIAACAAAAFLLLVMISLLCVKALSNVPLLQTEKKGLK